MKNQPTDPRPPLATPRRLLFGLAILASACGGGEGDDQDEDVAADAAQDTGSVDVDADAAADVGPELDADATVDLGEDSDAVDDVEVGIPERGHVWEQREHDESPAGDLPYPSEERTAYRTTDVLPDLDVRAIATFDDRVVVGAATGVFEMPLDGAAFAPLLTDLGAPVVDIARELADCDAGQCAVVATASQVWLVDPAGIEAQALRFESTDPIVAVAASGITIWVATSGGVRALAGEAITDWATDAAVLDLAAGSDGAVAATDDGVFYVRDGATTAHVGAGERFAALASCPDGTLLAGTAAGIVTVTTDGVEPRFTPGPGALAAGDVGALACDAGLVAAAHPFGASAIALDGDHFDYYVDGRWLLEPHATSVAVDSAGSRWFGSSLGIARIDVRERTLAEKAESRQEALDAYFWRVDGFVGAEMTTDDPWTFDGAFVSDKDNDGLWTQMMIGAWAMASTVTGDSAYCDEARRAMRNMQLLVDIPCVSFTEAGKGCGFIARSFVRDDEGPVYESKLTQDNWHPVEWTDGHTYLWKDDTSSDEIDGHTFGFPLFYDLCATEEERASIAATYGSVVRWIVDGGYQLIDLDGERTLHGIWDPPNISSCVDGLAACTEDFETCASACFGGGYLNSMQILGALLAAWHMTGDPFFYEEYDRLIVEERYDEVATNVRDVLTLQDPSIENHSDHELMMLAYHTLIRYEPNNERRERWIAALLEMIETERDERNPLWLAWVAGLTGEVIDAPLALQTLREFPWDQRTWTVDNSHRVDFQVDPRRDRFERAQFTAVPPYDELEAWWWNGNPKSVVQSGNPRDTQGPMAYLLAYWSMRYYGLLD
ncbi:MAG: hypothetical protein H6699_03665 [Myxococcales bacterium]|nr:hypothetical protein [Myxococcales bacterium]